MSKLTVNLAGYNVDTDILSQVTSDKDTHTNLTPETISAAYARISRSPDPVDVLRKKAAKDVKKARKSNETIVFEMGHASVSEHAVFNFDIIDVSRLAIEAIEHSRIGASFTEKSQRYITFDREKDEFVVPEELEEAGYGPLFRGFVQETHDQYHTVLDHIKDQERPQGGSPQEDARYLTTLAVTGQLGMTLNARSLGAMIRRLSSDKLKEVQDVGKLLFKLAKGVAPSLIKHVEPEPLRQHMLDGVRRAIHLNVQINPQGLDRVMLLTAPGKEGEGDAFLLASLLHQAGKGPFSLCHATVRGMHRMMQFALLRDVLKELSPWTPVPRQWELAELTFEVVCSASCFAQLKRHRMATVLPQAYDPRLGFVVPQSIQQDKQALKRFEAVMRASEAFHRKLSQKCSEEVAAYALTQAHCRRVLVRMNARELYHFSRLREDEHAQWEIRSLATEMLSQARECMPLTMALACGKDRFTEVLSQLFSLEDSEKGEEVTA